jgi:hypothetical protein
VDPQFWVKKPLAFAPIVDEETFNSAQTGAASTQAVDRSRNPQKNSAVAKDQGSA